MLDFGVALDGRTRFLDIVERIGAAVESGRLKPGDRLPPQRETASKLGVAVATVTKAYAEAQRRGLLTGSPGRGTFVAERPVSRGETAQAERTLYDCSTHLVPPLPPAEQLAALQAQERAVAAGARLFEPVPVIGAPGDREIGAAWLRSLGLEESAESVAVCSGSQHALVSVLSAITESGDAIGTEPLTDPSLRMVGLLLGRRLTALPTDGGGVDPDRLEGAIREQNIRALVLTPNIHNPTNLILSDERRRAIAGIAVACGIPIVENDMYGGLLSPRPLSLRSLARDRTFFISTFSKILGPSAKLAYVAIPPGAMEKVAAGIRMSLGMTPAVMTGLIGGLIASGEIRRLVTLQAEECSRRAALVEQALGGFEAVIHPASWHAWIALPEPWRVDQFLLAAEQAGIRLTSPAAFAVDRTETRQAVRLCFGGLPDIAALREVLARLVRLLGEPRTLAFHDI